MMELIMQELKNKKHQHQESQKVQSFLKDLELFLTCPILVLAYKWKL
jgi:hypothetical protein